MCANHVEKAIGLALLVPPPHFVYASHFVPVQRTFALSYYNF